MEEWLSWIRLNRTLLSSACQLALLNAFGSPQAVFEADEEHLLALPWMTDAHLAKIRRAKQSTQPEKDLNTLQRLGGHIVTCFDEAYPPLLKTLPDHPVVLYVRGQLVGDEPAVALVGTRRPSEYGRSVARRLSIELAEQGITVVSGLAQGIDTEAHEGALEGQGRTIAVLGCGIDVVYPKQNQNLAERIAERGALVSEFPLGMPAKGWHFPIRNRLISGVCSATIIVEAPQRSGALITADCALEQGRELFTIPGPVTSPNFRGNHQLLKEGAHLIESAQDVLEHLGLAARRPPVAFSTGQRATESGQLQPFLPALSEAERRIWELLERDGKHIDQIVREASLSPSQASDALLKLELKGLVQRQRGGTFVRA